MRIGYSFWGFLGSGITDTPDGGRSHRRTLIDATIDTGHDILFLQADRDRDEAGATLPYQWEPTGFPEIDVLMLEWRWPIPGRNTTTCAAPGHTCDLHRQTELLEFYTYEGLPTIVWDKDRQLRAGDPLRSLHNVTVCEAALHPSPGTVPLLFPVADDDLDAADPEELAVRNRQWRLAYVGNQYDRDEAFDQYFAPAAARHPDHVVAGKWTRTRPWPHVHFIGRVPFSQVDELYSAALTTIVLLPERHLQSGQMTQRLFEAVLAGCLPLCPTDFRSHDRLIPADLTISSGAQAADTIAELHAGSATRRAELLAACLGKLDLMRASRQVMALDALLTAGAAR